MADKKKVTSIRKKLLFSYLSLVALILLMGIIGIYNIREVYDNSNEIYVNNLTSVDYLKSINQNVKEIDRCIISMMSDLDLEYHDSYVTTIEKLQEENSRLMEQYSNLRVTKLEERRYNQCRLSILTFNKQIQSIMESLEAGNTEAATGSYEQELMPVKACTYELIEAVVELSTANAQKRNDNNQRIYRQLRRIITIAMILSVIIAIIITIKMSDYFTSKLAAIRRLAKRISEYNISDDIRGMSNDEFGETMEALNDSQFMMRELVERIIDESAIISDAGEEVSLAVRKSGQRIENVNVKVLQYGEKTRKIDDTIRLVLQNRSLDTETVDMLNDILAQAAAAREVLTDARAELSGVAMYLEQIGITSDYQNEIANSHKEQVKKFKV